MSRYPELTMKASVSHDGELVDVVLTDVAQPVKAFSFNVHAACFVPRKCTRSAHSRRKTSLLDLPREVWPLHATVGSVCLCP
jgi:hypothetical protein